MAGQRTSFGKIQRDGAKRAKAAAKRERRQDRDGDSTAADADGLAADPAPADDGPQVSAAEVMDLLQATHDQFEAGVISYERFEEEKAGLLARLQVD